MRIAPITAPSLAASLALAVTVLGSGASQAGESVLLRAAADLHQSPASAARVLRQLEAGERVESSGSRGDWVHVSISGVGGEPAVTGWIPQSAIEPDPSTAVPGSNRSEGR